MLVATMIALGFWQLRRLDEKRSYNALVESRQEQPIAEVTHVLPAADKVDDPEVTEVLYRRVRATGAYAATDTVVVPNRTFNGAPGAWVLTPLVLDDGTAVIVNRGFVGFERDGEIVAPDPPTGAVTVEGFIFPSQERGRFGGAGPADANLHELARANIEQFQDRVDYDLLPAYVQLVRSDPLEPAPSSGRLVVIGPPVLDEGPHFGYAVQWFSFTAIAAGGYVLLLRKVAMEEAKRSTGEMR